MLATHHAPPGLLARDVIGLWLPGYGPWIPVPQRDGGMAWLRRAPATVRGWSIREENRWEIHGRVGPSGQLIMPLWAAVAHVQTPSVEVTNTDTVPKAFGSNVTTGNALSAIFSVYNGDTPSVVSVADSLANDYSLGVQGNLIGISDVRGWTYYALNITGGSNTITVTCNEGSEVTLVISEFSGIATSDAVDGTPGSSSGSGTTASTSYTPGASGEVLLLSNYYHANGNRAITGDANFTLLGENEGGNSNMPIHAQYRIKTVASGVAESVQASTSSSSSWAITLLALKAAGVAPVDETAGPLVNSIPLKSLVGGGLVH